MTAITLEDALRKIAADNDLTNVTISVTMQFTPGPYSFSALGHYDGFAQSGIGCSRGTGETIAAALKDMLATARSNRTPPVSELPALSAEGVAA